MVTKGLAMVSLGFMVLFIGVQVIMREFNSPIVGDYEIVEMTMAVIISFGLAHAASKDAHISIGIVVDRLPRWMQTFSSVLGYVLTILVCLVIGITNLNVAFEYITTAGRASQMLAIPLYPFKLAIGIGFCLWALQAFLKLLMIFTSREEKSIDSPDGSQQPNVSLSSGENSDSPSW